MQEDPGAEALIEATAELARHLIRGGASPTEALSLVGPALLASRYGAEGLVLLGVGERTARVRTARVKELFEAANAAEDLLGADEGLGV